MAKIKILDREVEVPEITPKVIIDTASRFGLNYFTVESKDGKKLTPGDFNHNPKRYDEVHLKPYEVLQELSPGFPQAGGEDVYEYLCAKWRLISHKVLKKELTSEEGITLIIDLLAQVLDFATTVMAWGIVTQFFKNDIPLILKDLEKTIREKIRDMLIIKAKLTRSKDESSDYRLW